MPKQSSAVAVGVIERFWHIANGMLILILGTDFMVTVFVVMDDWQAFAGAMAIKPMVYVPGFEN